MTGDVYVVGTPVARWLRKAFIASVALLLVVTPAAAQDAQATTDFVPIPDIALGDRAKVDAVLGRPGSCSQTRYGPKCIYRRGAVEVVFIGGAADWITVNLPPRTPFATSALQALGLAARRPDASNANVMRWNGLGGLREVAVFPGNPGFVSYAYIKARTP
jgi:hypothetical protein